MTNTKSKLKTIDPVDHARVLNNTSIKRLKADAKSIKKAQQIQHHQALDAALSEHGITTGWHALIQMAKRLFGHTAKPTYQAPVVERNLLLGDCSAITDSMALDLWSGMNNADPDCNEWIIDLTGNLFMCCAVQSHLLHNHLNPAKVFNYMATSQVEPSHRFVSQYLLLDNDSRNMVAQAMFTDPAQQKVAHAALNQYTLDELLSLDTADTVLQQLQASRRHGLLALCSAQADYGYPSQDCMADFSRNLILFPETSPAEHPDLDTLWHWLRLISLNQKVYNSRVRLTIIGLPANVAIPNDLIHWLIHATDTEWVISAPPAHNTQKAATINALVSSADRTYAGHINLSGQIPMSLSSYRAQLQQLDATDGAGYPVYVFEHGIFQPEPVILTPAPIPLQKTMPILLHPNGQKIR